ncbi:hypothetical protein [Photobacterium kishitanii]|nr:hypothetical protein [Photobacterium kishitanii]
MGVGLPQQAYSLSVALVNTSPSLLIAMSTKHDAIRSAQNEDCGTLEGEK